MRPMRRSLVSIQRNLGKSILLFGLVTLTGALLAVAISTQQAISQTELRLRDQVPPVIALDWETHEIIEEFLTIEMIEELGSSMHVRTYDIRSRSGLDRRGLMPAIPPFDEFTVDSQNLDLMEIIESIAEGTAFMFGLDDHVIAIGVNTPTPVDLEFGLIELVEGRFINESEFENASEVVVISEIFAEVNHLQVGDILTLEYNVRDHWTPWLEAGEEMLIPAGEILHQRILELEIVGMFDINRDLVVIDTSWMVEDIAQL